MRQHKYCMHSIKKIGACRKRKKKKACQQVTSAPRDLLLQGTAAFIICGSRAAARPPASPARPACSGAGLAGRAQRREGAGAAPDGGPCGCPPLCCWMRVGGPAPRPALSLGRASRPGRGGGEGDACGEGSGPRDWESWARF